MMDKRTSYVVRVLVLLIIVLCLILFSLDVEGASDQVVKPITGTFLLFDWGFDPPDWRPYLDEIAELGMDTVVIAGIASVGKCPDYVVVSPFFDNGILGRFLDAAYDRDFSVYIGLAWVQDCVDNDTAIRVSLETVEKIRRLSLETGWGWYGNFIEGFYIPPELPIYALGGPNKWPKTVDLYKRLSSELKQKYPYKSVMISPYKFEWSTYQIIYDNICETIRETDIDIIAPQDSMGAGLVTSFERDREQFRAFADAVRDSNLALGKSVKAWANIETMKPSPKNGLLWKSQPTDIDTLSQQIEATEGLVEKRITWIYQWTMARVPLPDIPQYSNYVEERAQLRQAYLARFVIQVDIARLMEMIR